MTDPASGELEDTEDVAREPRIVVPVDTSDPGELPMELVEALGPMNVVVLGYYPVPDQTAPDQLREEYEEEARAAMRPVVRSFVEAGADVSAVLVFTRDSVESIDRVANEHACDAVLVPGLVQSLENVLVSLRAEENVFPVLEVVGLLVATGDTEVTLFHSGSVERESGRSELYLRGATDWLTEHGLDRERITWRETTEGSQESDLLDLAEEHDLVVTGEYEPGVRERVLGDLPDRIHERTGHPVLVVRREH